VEDSSTNKPGHDIKVMPLMKSQAAIKYSLLLLAIDAYQLFIA